MPGITGIIRKRATGNEKEKLRIMVDFMLHEPYYNAGTYINDELGYFIGYVSIENSYSDCMPIYNEKKDLLMFITGECYLDNNVYNNLLHKGHQFDPNNASFLIHLFEEYRDDFLANLNGWYNGIILDLNAKKAIIFNDRYGVRRIYYHENKDSFIFSSEAKSLLKAFHFLRKVNYESIGEYLIYDCVSENRTYFSEIYLLPPGSKWEFRHGNLDKNKYFSPEELENQTILTEKQFFEELRGTFKRILPRYLFGKNIGFSLTGGLDTRTIMASIYPSPKELNCYTFGGMYRDTFDVRFAPRVAKTCKQTYQLIKLNDEKFLEEYPFYVEKAIFLSDGLVSVDKADVIYFNKLSRSVAPIRITGVYGSQVLKNISGLRERSPIKKIINFDFNRFLSAAKDSVPESIKGHRLSSMLFKEIPWWWNGFVACHSTQIDVRSPYLDYDFIKVLYKAPSESLDFATNFQQVLIKEGNPELMLIPATSMIGGSSSVIISKIKSRLIENLILADKIFIREKLPYNMTHFMGKVDSLLSLFNFDKLVLGFADFRRYRVWYRDQLSEYLKETLLCDRTFNRPYWDKKYLSMVVNNHIYGRGTFLREIRKILQIEMIHRVLLEDI